MFLLKEDEEKEEEEEEVKEEEKVEEEVEKEEDSFIRSCCFRTGVIRDALCRLCLIWSNSADNGDPVAS